MLGEGLEEGRVGFRLLIHMSFIWETLVGNLELLQGVLVGPYVHPATYPWRRRKGTLTTRPTFCEWVEMKP